MLNDSEIRRLIGALHGATLIAQEAGGTEHLDLPQHEALLAALGAKRALEAVLGDASVSGLETDILEPLYTLVRKPAGPPVNDYTVRIQRYLGDNGWETVQDRLTCTSTGTPQDVALDVKSASEYLLQAVSGDTWRIVVWAGHGARPHDEPVFTLHEHEHEQVVS
jgi:hypothetical protein